MLGSYAIANQLVPHRNEIVDKKDRLDAVKEQLAVLLGEHGVAVPMDSFELDDRLLAFAKIHELLCCSGEEYAEIEFAIYDDVHGEELMEDFVVYLEEVYGREPDNVDLEEVDTYKRRMMEPWDVREYDSYIFVLPAIREIKRKIIEQAMCQAGVDGKLAEYVAELSVDAKVVHLDGEGAGDLSEEVSDYVSVALNWVQLPPGQARLIVRNPPGLREARTLSTADGANGALAGRLDG